MRMLTSIFYIRQDLLVMCWHLNKDVGDIFSLVFHSRTKQFDKGAVFLLVIEPGVLSQ